MKAFFLSVLLLSVCAACDLPRHYFNPAPDCVAAQASLDASMSDVYQGGVRARLAGAKPADFRYFFERFLDEQGQQIMVVNFRNEQECFNVKMHVPELGKLAGMHAAGGESYPEELYDLEWSLAVVDGVDQVVYEDVHAIVD